MIMIMSDPVAELFKDGRSLSFDANQPVFRTDDPVRLMYLVIEGEIDLLRFSSQGATLILARATPFDVVAEASAYSNAYHCDGIASVPSQLKCLSVEAFQKGLQGSTSATHVWTKRLAFELQSARTQSEIRSLKTVADRLDAWLSVGNTIPPHGRLQDLARILSVSREALYRELARRRSRP